MIKIKLPYSRVLYLGYFKKKYPSVGVPFSKMIFKKCGRLFLIRQEQINFDG